MESTKKSLIKKILKTVQFRYFRCIILISRHKTFKLFIKLCFIRNFSGSLSLIIQIIYETKILIKIKLWNLLKKIKYKVTLKNYMI